MDEIPRTEVFVAQAKDGFVLLDGAGVARTLQPGSALHLADLLTDAATEAAGQRTIAGLSDPLKKT
jgi:hypothetical protein